MQNKVCPFLLFVKSRDGCLFLKTVWRQLNLPLRISTERQATSGNGVVFAINVKGLEIMNIHC